MLQQAKYVNNYKNTRLKLVKVNAVGTATRHGLDGLGWSEIFHTRPDQPWGPTSLLYKGYRISFSGVKQPRRGVDHPPPSSAKVKERVEHLYSPSGPLWPVLG
jgi:hypothetical protein